MRFFLTALILISSSVSWAGISVQWSLGAEQRQGVKISTQEIDGRDFLVIESVGDELKKGKRVVTEKTYAAVMKSWDELKMKPISPSKTVFCGSIIVFSQKNSATSKEQFYCGSGAALDQKLKFKSFYEKLLKLSRNEIPFFE